MKCCNCGHLLPKDSEFCQYCGKKIETEILIQKNEDIIDADATTETDEIDLPDLGNVTPKEALDAIIKMQAGETVKNFAENEKNQPNNEDDIDFGLIPEKPIYTLAIMSVDGEREYLNQLYTENGVKIKWDRRGSTSVAGVRGPIDMYDTYLPSGELYKTIYINMYGSKKSEKAPVGFALNNVETQRKQNSFKEEKQKNKFCKLCGNQIDSETKKCGGCGKQYFKGVKFDKFLTTVLILSFVIITSVILNVVQILEINSLNETISSHKATVSSQKNTISSQKSTITSLEVKSDYFDTICKELSSGNIGYASSNFKTSESIIVVDKNEANRKFTLTANWTNGGTVYVDYSGSAAKVSFDNDSWNTSTKMTVEPKFEGVTVVTFSNNVNSKIFKILIIVTD